MALTQVKSDGIATGAVTATQIATGAVTANDLEDSGVTAGTYGSSSAIPAITVDAKGRITSASTSSIDSTAITNGTSNVSVAASADITFTQAGNEKARVDSQGFLFGDNDKARFGNGGDLQIYHNGSNSYIQDTGTGDLLVIGETNIILQSNAGEEYIRATNNGAVSLKYDNSTKLATTSGGIDVTGLVTCDGVTSEGDVNIRSGSGGLVLRDNNSSGNSATPYILMEDSTGADKVEIGLMSTGNQDVTIRNKVSAAIIFATNNTDRCFVDATGHFIPSSDQTYDLGTSSNRWRNVYTNDLNLSNEGNSNDVDGTWGSWTIQEGEDDLFLLNRRNGKKYKFNLTEVD